MAPTETFTLDYQGQPLRIVMEGEERWFVIVDLCRILNIYMRHGKPITYEAMRRLRPSAKAHRWVETSCGPRAVSVVNEEGLLDMAFWAKHRGRPDLFVWDVNEAMVSARAEPVAASRPHGSLMPPVYPQRAARGAEGPRPLFRAPCARFP